MVSINKRGNIRALMCQERQVSKVSFDKASGRAIPPNCKSRSRVARFRFLLLFCLFQFNAPPIATLVSIFAGLLLATSLNSGAEDLLSSTTFTNRPHARVVIAEHPGATEAFRPRMEAVREMVNRGITNLTRKASPREAWLSLVSTQDVVGLKVYSAPGPNSGTRPSVVAAIVEGLLAAGLPSRNIIVWDRQMVDLRLAGFVELGERYHVRVAGSAQAGYDAKTFYDTPLIGNLVWGDVEFGKTERGAGRKSFVSKLVSQDMTKIINVTPLLNNNIAGVSGNLFSLAMGSVDNTLRFESDTTRLAKAVPEIYALPSLGDRVVLNVVDALICQYEGGEHSLLHYSTVLNQLRFSRDPVALDVLSLQELQRQRNATRAPHVKPNPDLIEIASVLELGVNDPRQIDIETIRCGQQIDLPWR
jgi:hypothetical protein